jgi:hypothetical protein
MEITYENIYSFGYLKAQIFNNFYVQAIDPNNKLISIASFTSDSIKVLSSFNDKVGIQNDPKIIATIVKDRNA